LPAPGPAVRAADDPGAALRRGAVQPNLPLRPIVLPLPVVVWSQAIERQSHQVLLKYHGLRHEMIDKYVLFNKYF